MHTKQGRKTKEIVGIFPALCVVKALVAFGSLLVISQMYVCVWPSTLGSLDIKNELDPKIRGPVSTTLSVRRMSMWSFCCWFFSVCGGRKKWKTGTASPRDVHYSQGDTGFCSTSLKLYCARSEIKSESFRAHVHILARFLWFASLNRLGKGLGQEADIVSAQ